MPRGPTMSAMRASAAAIESSIEESERLGCGADITLTERAHGRRGSTQSRSTQPRRRERHEQSPELVEVDGLDHVIVDAGFTRAAPIFVLPPARQRDDG